MAVRLTGGRVSDEGRVEVKFGDSGIYLLFYMKYTFKRLTINISRYFFNLYLVSDPESSYFWKHINYASCAVVNLPLVVTILTLMI